MVSMGFTTRFALLLTSLVMTVSVAHGKVFRNAYVSFELPEKWDCVLEQTEWVCRPTDPAQAPKAIIILTAKEVGPADTLAAYAQHLRTPRTIASRTGKPIQSHVYKVEQNNIANHPWVDAMHMASEVPNYYTRYLATTKDKIAVLVTFSAHKLHYTQFNNDFFRSIQSLRVVATRSLMNRQGDGISLPGSETLGMNTQMQMGFDDDFPEEGSGGSGSGSSGAVQAFFGLALVLAAIGIFLILRRGKKKKR